MTTDQVRDDNLREPHLEEGVYSIWEVSVYSIWEVGVFNYTCVSYPTPTFHLLFPILHLLTQEDPPIKISIKVKFSCRYFTVIFLTVVPAAVVTRTIATPLSTPSSVTAMRPSATLSLLSNWPPTA